MTLKAMSESLSSWEPLRDPDGDGIAGPDCRVPGTKETPSCGRCSAGPRLRAALPLSLPGCLTGSEGLVQAWRTSVTCLPGRHPPSSPGHSTGVCFTHTVQAGPIGTPIPWFRWQFREGHAAQGRPAGAARDRPLQLSGKGSFCWELSLPLQGLPERSQHRGPRTPRWKGTHS